MHEGIRNASGFSSLEQQPTGENFQVHELQGDTIIVVIPLHCNRL